MTACFGENAKQNTESISTASQSNKVLGVQASLNKTCLPKLTYEDIFYRERVNHRGGGMYKTYGFPMQKGNWCTNLLKVNALNYGVRDKASAILHGGAQTDSNRAFSKSPNTTGDTNIVQYLGIAADEPERIERHKDKKGIMLPLVMAGWDEAYCRKWCEERDLLSPIYTTATRGGCWFCHNQGVDQLRLLRKNYPDLWALLMKWDLDSPTTFKADGHTVHDYDRRFAMEDERIIDPSKPWFWKYLDEVQLRIDLTDKELDMAEEKEIYRKESEVVKEVLEKVMSFTAEDEVGLKWLIRNLAREYGVELSGKLIKMRAN